ncbi:I78 family peptidase inhibitor [Tabrizicola sp.]|uniref:I78 family peptidase inhibitor n=1 Tax=Tabrizicola sp. TaxID=2005166 RepID=UPI003F3CE6B3
MRSISLVMALALAACVPVTTPGPDRMPPEPAPGSDACGASTLQYLVGKDKSVFAAMSFVAGTRFIEPGMPITMDYSPTRLNFDLNSAGRITRVWCG